MSGSGATRNDDIPQARSLHAAHCSVCRCELDGGRVVVDGLPIELGHAVPLMVTVVILDLGG